MVLYIINHVNNFATKKHTKTGFIYDYTQVTTHNRLPPPQPSVWLSVTQIGRTKFPLSKFSILAFLKWLKSKFPLSGLLFASKFSVNSRNFYYIFKKKKKHYKELAPGGGLLNSTPCWTVYMYTGHAWFCTQWPLKRSLGAADLGIWSVLHFI